MLRDWFLLLQNKDAFLKEIDIGRPLVGNVKDVRFQ